MNGSLPVDGSKEVGFGSSQLALEVREEFVHSWRAMRSWEHPIQRSGRILPVQELEWSKACGGVDAVVVGEFGTPQPPGPILAFMVHIGTEILHNSAVVTLHLPVGLRMMGSCETKPGAHPLHDEFPKLCTELGSTVMDDLSGKAVMADDFMEEEVHSGGSVLGVRTRSYVQLLGEAVHEDNHVGVTGLARLWETPKKVH